MNDRDKLIAITAWLTRLKDLTVGSRQDDREMKDQIALYALVLIEDFDADAFTMLSLVAVAGQCKFWPAYGELRPLLRSWWQENRPLPVMIASEIATPSRRSDPTPEEIAYVHAKTQEAIAAMRPAWMGAQTAVDVAANTSPPKPQYLTAERLAAIRDANPLVRAARQQKAAS